MPSSAIPKRKLGNTGLEVTVLGMGGAPLGGLFQVRGAALTYFVIDSAYIIAVRLYCRCMVVAQMGRQVMAALH